MSCQPSPSISDDADGARLTDREFLLLKGEIAFVPKDGIRTSQIRQHQIQIAVTVEIVNGQTGTVTIELLDNLT